MAEVFEYSRAKYAARLVLLALADHADDEQRTAWPSLTRLGVKCRLDRANVARSLRTLEQLGELVRERAPGGGHETTRYRIPSLPVVSECNQCQGDTSVTAPLELVSIPPQTSVTARPKPSEEEPSQNHHTHRARATWRRVPPSEALTDARRADAERLGLPASDVQSAWDEYLDIEFARPHRDVDATWRNSVRIYLRQHAHHGPAQSIEGMAERIRRRGLI